MEHMARQKKVKPIKGHVKIGKARRGIIFLAKPSVLSVIFSSMATISLVAALTAAGIPIIWMIWYRVAPGTTQALSQVLRRPVTSFAEQLDPEATEVEVYQPPLDPSLPAENRLIIPTIGVNTQIVEEPLERHEEAFKVGVWRVPDFGTAFSRERPMILAAHRFGYLAWTNTYRRENSFYNLPKLEKGDQVEVIWGQRRYLYEIYEGEESEEITNYTADLILYTCRFLESEVRIFRYARLMKKVILRLSLMAVWRGRIILRYEV
jgi:sortase (surface protein transpeptidase)